MAAVDPLVISLLQAMSAALDVPTSAAHRDEHAKEELLDARARLVRSALDAILANPETSLPVAPDFLRQQTARLPVTYTPCEPTAQAGDA